MVDVASVADTVPIKVAGTIGEAEDVSETSSFIGGIPTAVPAGSGNNNNESDDTQTVKLAQLMTIGNGMVSYIGKANPLQGISSVAEATAKARKEAKDLINPVEFSKPKDRSEWISRVSSNASYFRLSYSITYAVTMVYFVLTSPFILFEIATIGGLWALFFKLNKADDVVTIGQYKLGRKEKMLVLGPLTTFVAFFGGLLSSFIYIFFLGSFFVGLHASFRKPVQPDPLEELEQGPEQFV